MPIPTDTAPLPATAKTPIPTVEGKPEPYLWQQAAQAEIATATRIKGHLWPKEKRAIVEKHQAAAQGPLLTQQYGEQVNTDVRGAGGKLGQFLLDKGTAAGKGFLKAASAPLALVAPETVQGYQEGLDESYYTPPSLGNRVAGVVGGAAPTLLTAISSGGAPAVAGLSGVQRAGGARMEVAELREQGVEVSGADELAGTIGQGVLGAAEGYAQGKLMNLAGGAVAPIANPATRAVSAVAVDAAGNALLAAPSMLGQNLVAQQTYDPQRELTAGVGDAVLEGAASGAVLGLGAIAPANRAHRQHRAQKFLGTDAVTVLPKPPPQTTHTVAADALALGATGHKPVWFDAGDDFPRRAFVDPRSGRIYLSARYPAEAAEEAFHAIYRQEPLRPALDEFAAEQPDLVRQAGENYLMRADQADPAVAAKVRARPELAREEGIANLGAAALTPESLTQIAAANPGKFLRIAEKVLDVFDRMRGADPRRSRVAERRYRQFVEPLRANIDQARAKLEAETDVLERSDADRRLRRGIEREERLLDVAEAQQTARAEPRENMQDLIPGTDAGRTSTYELDEAVAGRFAERARRAAPPREQPRLPPEDREELSYRNEEAEADRRLERFGGPVRTTAIEPTPEAKQVRRPRGWTRGELEERMIAAGRDVDPEEIQSRIAADTDAHGEIFTFRGKLPAEVREFLEGRPEARRLFRVADPGDPNAAGDDAVNHDDYFTLAEVLSGSKLGAALKSAQRSDDPTLRFARRVHANQAAAAKVTGDAGEKDLNKRNVTRTRGELAKDQVAVDAGELQYGVEGTIDGVPFRVREDPDQGVKVIDYDGESFPAELLGEIPVDQGSLRAAEPAPERAPDDDVAPFSVRQREDDQFTSGRGGTDWESAAARVKVGRKVRIDGHEIIVTNVSIRARTTPKFNDKDPGATDDAEQTAVVASVTGHMPGNPLQETKPFTFYSRPQAKPARGPTSDAGVFGQEILRPATGKSQGTLFHRPVEPEKPAENPRDARIRKQYTAGERSTPDLFSEGAPRGSEDARQRQGSQEGQAGQVRPAQGDDPVQGRPVRQAQPRLEAKPRLEEQAPQPLPQVPQQRPDDDRRGRDRGDEGGVLIPLRGQEKAPSEAPAGDADAPDFTIDELSTVALRKLARARGISPHGTRQELLEQLHEANRLQGDEYVAEEDRTALADADDGDGETAPFAIAGKKSLENLPEEDRARARANLNAALYLKRKGKDAQAIRLATGWFQGPYDKKWRYEIDDSKMRFRPGAMSYDSETGNLHKSVSLGHLVDHPELYRAYPGLEKILTHLIIDKTTPAGYLRGHYRTGTSGDEKFKGRSPEIQVFAHDEALARRGLLHEIQHAVQFVEGFAKGANTSVAREQPEYRRLVTRLKEDRDQGGLIPPGQDPFTITPSDEEIERGAAYRTYQNYAGEIEARDVESRADMTAGDRAINLAGARRLTAQAREIGKGEAYQAESAAGEFDGPEHLRVRALYDEIEAMGFKTVGRDQMKALLGDDEAAAWAHPAPYGSERIPREDALVRFSVGGKGKGKSQPQQSVGFEDADVERRYQEARGIERPGLFERLKAGLKTAKENLTRHWIHLDTKKREDAELANMLRLRQAEVESAPDLAKRAVEEWIRPLRDSREDYERFGRLLVLPDILKDVDRGLYDGKTLPFGFRNRGQVEKELARLEAAAAQSPALKEALDRRAKAQKSLTHEMVDLKLLKPEVLEDDRYYHRQVMQYVNAREEATRLGGDRGAVKLGKKGFQKQREGGGDFNTAYEQAEFEYLTHAFRQIATARSLRRIKARFDKTAELKRQHGAHWRDHVPDGHVVWSPKVGTQFARVMTLPESAIERLLSYETDLADYRLKEMFARIPGEQYVLPEHFAKQLDDTPAEPTGWLDKLAGAGMASWKQWTLLNPFKAVIYNVNNTAGDVDVALAADPRIVAPTRLVKAGKDLAAWARGKAGLDPAVAAEIEKAHRLGVLGGQTSESLAEIPGISEQGVFAKLTGRDTAARKLNPLNWYWSRVKNFTALREGVVRLSAYRRALELIDAGGAPAWASQRHELDAIPDRHEKAAKLSRDLVGDYGNVSVAGQTIRQRYVPFWSWMEINLPRYARLFTNQWRGGEPGKALTTAAAGTAGLALRASALYMAVHLFNKALFPGEDDGFEDGRLRLLVGKDGAGNVFGVRFQGAFSDALAWFGLEDLPGKVAKLSRGEASLLGDVVPDMAKAAPTKLINAALPIQKTVGEALAGKSLFPDPFNPRPIRDRAEHLARAASLDQVYRAARDIPQPSPLTRTAGLYSANAGETAYNQARSTIHDWLEDQGIQRGAGEPTDRSNALYYHKKALAMGDDGAAKKWLDRYFELGGSDEGMKRSIESAHPLAGVPVEKRAELINSLSPEQAQKLERAKAWYYETYYAEDPKGARERWDLKLELSGLEAREDAWRKAREALRDQKGDRASELATLRASRLDGRQRARLDRLRSISRSIRSVEEQEKKGRITAGVANTRIERLLRAV